MLAEQLHRCELDLQERRLSVYRRVGVGEEPKGQATTGECMPWVGGGGKGVGGEQGSGGEKAAAGWAVLDWMEVARVASVMVAAVSLAYVRSEKSGQDNHARTVELVFLPISKCSLPISKCSLPVFSMEFNCAAIFFLTLSATASTSS